VGKLIKQVSGIYKIICGKNNKFYIGSSKNIDKRFQWHKSRLKNNTHCNIHIQRSWNKYGPTCFSFCIIEEVDINNLLYKEQYWINKTKSYKREIGFNLAKDVLRPRLNVKNSKKTRLKISLALKGRKIPWLHTKEVQKKIAISNTGRRVSRKTKIKISNKLKGRKLSESHKFKISKTLKGTHRPKSVREKISKSHLGIPKPLSSQKGSVHGMAITNEKTVKNILIDFKNGLSCKKISIKYNMNYNTTYSIISKHTWKHVKI
jgi:group I intron endonuclease